MRSVAMRLAPMRAWPRARPPWLSPPTRVPLGVEAEASEGPTPPQISAISERDLPGRTTRNYGGDVWQPLPIPQLPDTPIQHREQTLPLVVARDSVPVPRSHAPH